MTSYVLKYCYSTLILIFISISVSSNAANISPFTLKPIQLPAELSQVKTNNLATIAMIFQPNCSWCKKQGKILKKVLQQCQSSTNIALVGTRGNSRQLRKELKHYHQAMPAFIADRQFLRRIGGYQASPTLVIFDKKGELIAKKRGFIPEPQLASALTILTEGACQL